MAVATGYFNGVWTGFDIDARMLAASSVRGLSSIAKSGQRSHCDLPHTGARPLSRSPPQPTIRKHQWQLGAMRLAATRASGMGIINNDLGVFWVAMHDLHDRDRF